MTSAPGPAAAVFASSDASAALQGTLDAMAASVAILDGAGTIVAVNQAWRRGAAADGISIEAAIGRSYLGVCDEGARAGSAGASEVGETIRAVLRGDIRTGAVEYPCHCETAERWYTARISTIADTGALRVMVAHEDRTAGRLAERRCHDQQELLSTVDAAIVATDPTGVVTEWSGGAERTLGWPATEAVGRPLLELVSSLIDDVTRREIRETIGHHGSWQGEIEVRRQDGTAVPMFVRSGALLGDDGRLRGYLGVSIDISRRVELERRLRVSADFMSTVTQAMADGLYVLDESGRLTFMNRAAEEMLGWTSAELEGALLHDVIHTVHPDGSPHPFPACPITVARATGEAIRVERDVFVRRSGETFAVSYSSVPFETEHGERGSVVVFEDITERLADERKVEAELRALDTVSQIRAAIRDRRMVLFAQPIVSLETGRTVQHELLIRMRSEAGDLVPPGDFLPVAEAYGLIREIDRYVIREAMGFAGAGHPVELNLSADSLSDPSLLHFVQGELEAYDVDPSLVVFEITETALMADEATALNFVTGAAELGCAVALDDFGTGYGGFHYLKHLPVKYLKIDREFVTDIHLGGADQHVVEAIVSLARALGQVTVAEGVEDPQTLSRLRELGVDQAQGWALGRPAPIEEVYATSVERSGS